MKFLVDKMPKFADYDCLFSKQRRDKEETYVIYCKLMNVECDLEKESAAV